MIEQMAYLTIELNICAIRSTPKAAAIDEGRQQKLDPDTPAYTVITFCPHYSYFIARFCADKNYFSGRLSRQRGKNSDLVENHVPF